MKDQATVHAITQLTSRIKQSRLERQWSQTELGERVGLNQKNVSRIEASKQDLRTSTLVELARAVGLELMLVPRAMVPAIQSILRTETLDPGEERPLYSLDDDDDEDDDVEDDNDLR